VSPQQQAFVNAYLTVAKGNGTKAAIAAGYSERTAGVQASQLLKRPEIREAIQKALYKADLTTQARLEKLAKIADTTPESVNASDVIAANKLILQVNGALEGKKQTSGVTVNIGFITAPTDQQPAISISDGTTTLVMPPQAQITDSGDSGG
jgi:hypothetical protein